MDARTGFVHPAITLGIAPLVAAAREHGVAMLSLTRSLSLILSLNLALSPSLSLSLSLTRAKAWRC